MAGADARLQEFVSGTQPLLTRLPGAVCIIKQDRFFTLLWANEMFYELMGCSEDEMGFRYARRISALWDAESVERLVQAVRDGAEGRPVRFRHHPAKMKDARVLETEAVLLPEAGALCCLTRDCTHEEGCESQLAQLRQLGVCVAETADLELFAYDARTRSARVIFADAVLGQLDDSRSVFADFPNTLIRAGLVHPDDVNLLRNAFDAPVEQNMRSACDIRLGGPAPETGRWRWYRMTLAGCANTFLPGGATGGGVLMDITEHKELAMSYLNETQFYYALLSEKDAYGHVDVTEDAIVKIGGMWNLYNELIDTVSYTDIVTTFIEKVVHPDDRAHYLDLMRCENLVSSLENGIDQLGCEFRRIVEQNKMAWMELSVHLLKDPTTHHVLALMSIKNIDKKKRQELQLKSSSQRDPLTQVLHKTAAETAMRARLRSSARRDVSAFIILDIDDFKSINDCWGHKVGDKSLMRFVHDVRCLTGKDDVLGRFGGDEFVLFVANAFDRDYVSRLIEDLYARLAVGHEPVFTCSAGIALMSGGMSYDEGFRLADEALYEAKAAGKATFRFRGAGDDEGEPSTYAFERCRRMVPGEDAVEGASAAALGKGIADAPLAGEQLSFAEFLSAYGEIAYLVDPDTFTLICGNEAFYERIGETPVSCMGKKCYEAMQGRKAPCPFCSKANWATDKFFMWRNNNNVLDQEFLIKNKLVPWQGREALLAIAVDVSNDKSIVDSLDSGMSEGHCLLGGIQQMNAAHDLAEVVDCALEAIGGFFRAAGVRLWTKERDDAPYRCAVAWSREPGAFLPLVADDRSLDAWLAAQSWDEPVMVESPESILRSSYSMYCFMKDNGVANERWIRLMVDAGEHAQPIYLSVENLGANFQNVSFLESFSVFMASELGRRHMMESLLHAGSHDEMTGLLNREYYERRLDSFDGDNARSIGVMMANVNGMKTINDSKGFAAGNYYLQQFAAMLLDVFPPDEVYRLNGDEFAVIALDLDREELESRMRELRAMVQSNGLFSVAIGYSWDQVEKDLGLLTNQAVRAMEADKRRYHDVARDHTDDDRRTQLRNLVTSLENGEFSVYLQPKVLMGDTRVIGAEALIRYRDPELGIVSPARFVQGLEESGLIRHVDLFVFEQVCQALERWERDGVALPVSLNLSRRTLLENDLVASMQSIMAQRAFDRRNLEIEITESFAVIGKSVLYQAANDLIDAGFSLSLDDFGTKYTDLSILSSIDFSMIKLDKSLIDAIVEDAAMQTVLKHVIGMCDELRVDVIAEGIETTEQEQVLRRLGCRYGQGYLYGRPIPCEDFERLFLYAHEADEAGV